MIKPNTVTGTRIRRNIEFNETIKGVKNGRVTDSVQTNLSGSTSGEDSSNLSVSLTYKDADKVKGLGASVVGEAGDYRLQIKNGSSDDGFAIQELPLPGVEKLDESYKSLSSGLGVNQISVRGRGDTPDKLDRLEIQLGDFGSYLLSDGEMRLFQRGQFKPVNGVTTVDSDVLGTIRGRAGKYGSSFHESLASETMTNLRNSILGGERANYEHAEMLGEGWRKEYGGDNEANFEIRMQSGDRQRLSFNLKDESMTFQTSQSIPGQFHSGSIDVTYKVSSDGTVTRDRQTHHG